MIGNLLVGRMGRCAGLFLLALSTLTAETSVTIATFNIEWLGYPRNSGEWYGSRDSQLETAAQEILALDADIIALQEVIVDEVNGDALADLLVRLNASDAQSQWEGVANEKFSFWWRPDFSEYPAQRQAYIWRSARVGYVDSQVLLDWIPAWDDRFGSGRLPFLLEVEVGQGPAPIPLKLVNLHLKCCRGSSERRSRSMKTLLDELHAGYREDPLIVLGDFNVADEGGATGEISAWGFYQDDDLDGEPDFLHAAGAVADLYWDDIDHIMLSDELRDAYLQAPQASRNRLLGSVVSDHGPVLTQLVFPSAPADLYAAWSGPAFAGHPEFAGKTAYGDDPDLDGIVNFVEFVLGGDPAERDAARMGVGIRLDGNGELLVSHDFRAELPPETAGLHVSDSLEAALPWPLLANPAMTVRREPTHLPGMEKVEYAIPLSSLQPSCFFILSVEIPE